jgi:hypothetical protein
MPLRARASHLPHPNRHPLNTPPGYGQETANRTARHTIPHTVYKDANGTEHVRVSPEVVHTALSLNLRLCRPLPPAAHTLTPRLSRPRRPPPPLCHPQLQFHLRGPGGSGLVNADMFKGEAGAWEYAYLIVDVAAGGAPPQRLNIIVPR